MSLSLHSIAAPKRSHKVIWLFRNLLTSSISTSNLVNMPIVLHECH